MRKVIPWKQIIEGQPMPSNDGGMLYLLDDFATVWVAPDIAQQVKEKPPESVCVKVFLQHLISPHEHWIVYDIPTEQD